MIVLRPQLAGRFRAWARRPDGRVHPVLGWSRNLVLDQGLDLIGTSTTYLDACQVGTSDVPASAQQTALLAPLAGTANRTAANSAANSAAPWRGYSQITYAFSAGAVVGDIRELGVGPSATPGSPLFARFSPVNALGSGYAARVLADEVLEVEYELSLYAPVSDAAGTLLIDGEPHSYVARAALASTAQHWAPYRADAVAAPGQAVQAVFAAAGGAQAVAYDGALGDITATPAGVSANVSYVADTAYIPGSRQRRGRLHWDLAQANFGGGIRSLAYRLAVGSGSGGNSLGAYQVEIAPPAPKTDRLLWYADIGITWGRA